VQLLKMFSHEADSRWEPPVPRLVLRRLHLRTA